MFVGGRMRIDAPFPIGVPVRRTASVGEVVHKMGRSGQLAFVTLRFAYSAEGRTIALEEQDLVYRPDASLGSAASARAQGSVSSTGPVPEDEPALKGEVTFNEPMLFRFSALTFNSHRIHYDLPYARDVEHYPGLVVQGPLLIVRLLELVREAHGDAAVRELSFRAVEPCFCGSTVTLSGRSKGDDGLHLVASRDGVALMTADVALRRGST
jgi:3-methylfumaryl-CoA hydratase